MQNRKVICSGLSLEASPSLVAVGDDIVFSLEGDRPQATTKCRREDGEVKYMKRV